MANEIIVYPGSSNDYYFQYEGGGGVESNGMVRVGYSQATGRKIRGAIRLPSVDIPQGSNITDSGINIYVEDREGSAEIRVKVWGIDEDNTSDFGSNPFGRTKTTAYNTHQYSGGSGGYFGIGVGNIVTEIVGRSGWSSGNAIGFIIEDDGTTTDSPGNYLWDYYGGTDSYLNFRVGAEPNFKPTPISVSAPTFPAVDSYGIKISHPGYDVLTATDSQIYFTTRKRTLKVISQGKINTTGGSTYTIAHGQSYKPFTRAYFKSVSSTKRYKIPRFIPGTIQDPDADTTNAQIEVDGTNVRILTDDSCEVYYYIYVDQLAT